MVGDHVLREEERPLDGEFFALRQKLRHAVIPLGADGNDRLKVHLILIRRDHRQKGLLLDRVDLVDDQNARHVRRLDLTDQLLFLNADVCDRLDHQNHGVHVRDGAFDDVHHIVSELRPGLVEARRIDENELTVLAVDDGADAVAGRLRLVGNNGDLLADDGVGQRGFADVRTACNGDHGGFIFHKCILSIL